MGFLDNIKNLFNKNQKKLEEGSSTIESQSEEANHIIFPSTANTFNESLRVKPEDLSNTQLQEKFLRDYVFSKLSPKFSQHQPICDHIREAFSSFYLSNSEQLSPNDFDKYASLISIENVSEPKTGYQFQSIITFNDQENSKSGKLILDNYNNTRFSSAFDTIEQKGNYTTKSGVHKKFNGSIENNRYIYSDRKYDMSQNLIDLGQEEWYSRNIEYPHIANYTNDSEGKNIKIIDLTESKCDISTLEGAISIAPYTSKVPSRIIENNNLDEIEKAQAHKISSTYLKQRIENSKFSGELKKLFPEFYKDKNEIQWDSIR